MIILRQDSTTTSSFVVSLDRDPKSTVNIALTMTTVDSGGSANINLPVTKYNSTVVTSITLDSTNWQTGKQIDISGFVVDPTKRSKTDQIYKLSLTTTDLTNKSFNELIQVIDIKLLSYQVPSKGNIIASKNGDYTDENGASVTVAVHLDRPPLDTVGVHVYTSNNDIAWPEGSTAWTPFKYLLFTPQNYNTDQLVKIVGKHVESSYSDQPYTVECKQLSSVAADPNGFANTSLVLTNRNIDIETRVEKQINVSATYRVDSEINPATWVPTVNVTGNIVAGTKNNLRSDFSEYPEFPLTTSVVSASRDGTVVLKFRGRLAGNYDRVPNGIYWAEGRMTPGSNTRWLTNWGPNPPSRISNDWVWLTLDSFPTVKKYAQYVSSNPTNSNWEAVPGSSGGLWGRGAGWDSNDYIDFSCAVFEKSAYDDDYVEWSKPEGNHLWEVGWAESYIVLRNIWPDHRNVSKVIEVVSYTVTSKTINTKTGEVIGTTTSTPTVIENMIFMDSTEVVNGRANLGRLNTPAFQVWKTYLESFPAFPKTALNYYYTTIASYITNDSVPLSINNTTNYGTKDQLAAKINSQRGAVDRAQAVYNSTPSKENLNQLNREKNSLTIMETTYNNW